MYESRVISLLLKKYGANRPFKTDIVFAAIANNEVGSITGSNFTAYESFPVSNAAWGHYYACLISSENDSNISHWIKLIPVVEAYRYYDDNGWHHGFVYTEFQQWAMLNPSGVAISRSILGTNSLPLLGKFEYFDIYLWYSSSEISLL